MDNVNVDGFNNALNRKKDFEKYFSVLVKNLEILIISCMPIWVIFQN